MNIGKTQTARVLTETQWQKNENSEQRTFLRWKINNR